MLFVDDICNLSDHHGRYALSQQPLVMAWNAARFRDALAVLEPTLRDTHIESHFHICLRRETELIKNNHHFDRFTRTFCVLMCMILRLMCPCSQRKIGKSKLPFAKSIPNLISSHCTRFSTPFDATLAPKAHGWTKNTNPAKKWAFHAHRKTFIPVQQRKWNERND